MKVDKLKMTIEFSQCETWDFVLVNTIPGSLAVSRVIKGYTRRPSEVSTGGTLPGVKKIDGRIPETVSEVQV